MKERPRDYLYALHYDWLTFLYDPIVKWTTREYTFKKALGQQGGIQPNHKVLDLGCGTGTLALIIKESIPQSMVVGCDGDKKILQLAQGKAVRTNRDMIWHCAMAYALPYADESFDRVVSSFLFHHLTKEDKLRTLREVYRILKPGGELHLADWGKPQNKIMRLAFLVIQLLDGFETTADNVQGLLIKYLQEAGFAAGEETKRYLTIFGTLSLYKAQKARD